MRNTINFDEISIVNFDCQLKLVSSLVPCSSSDQQEPKTKLLRLTMEPVKLERIYLFKIMRNEAF